MDATLELAVVVTLVIGVALLLHFGGGMTTETIMSGGMMGSGNMGGNSLGVVLFSSLSGDK